MQMSQIKDALKYLIEFSVFQETSLSKLQAEKETVSRVIAVTNEEPIAETDTSFVSQEKTESWKESFVKWLTEDQHLSESTCASLISAIRKSYQFGVSQGLSLEGFFSDDVSSSQKRVSELLLYPGFIEFDNGQNHRYSFAVKKYLQYLKNSSLDEDKKAGSEITKSIDSNAASDKPNSSIAESEEKKTDATQPKESRYLREDKEAFYCWLRDNQHMADRTCHSYVSNVRSAERIAKEHNLSSIRLFTDDCNEAKATADALFSDAGFVEYNKEQHNRFSAAI